MALNDAVRLESAKKVHRELALENELTRPQARAYVRCLQTTWHVPTIRWYEDETNKQLYDARRLMHAAHIFRLVEGRNSSAAIDCFRRAGEILEWLSRAEHVHDNALPIDLLAAAAFQLGGLPAIANSLLEQANTKHDGVKLYAAFFQARFDAVLHHVSEFWRKAPELTDRLSSQALYKVMRLDDANSFNFTRATTAELVRILGLLADCIRRGDDVRMAVAKQKLDALDQLVSRTFSDNISLLVGLLRQVSEEYIETSIYKPLSELAEIKPERTEFLRSYARKQFYLGRGLLWKSQQQGLKRLVQDSSFALCTPTGSGKTLVANLAIIKELLLCNDDVFIAPLALYIVPSRALAGEVEGKLASELKGEVVVTGLYGGADWGITDNWLTSESPVVLIATVEKAEALIRYLGPILVARLKLLLVDEAHQVVPEKNDDSHVSFSDHTNRALRLESLVTRLISLRPDIVRIALTAVAGGASAPVSKWVEGSQEAHAVGVNYRSTRQVVGMLETNPGFSGQILLDLMNGRPLYLRGREDPVYLPLQFPPMPQLKPQWRNSLNRFNNLSVLWTALHLTEEGQRILISVAQEPEKTMRWFREALELEDWGALINFVPPEGEPGETFREALATCADYCGSESHELFLLERGIASNHGQMPQRLRRLMNQLIEKKICPITIATATLTEGVNLPFDIIFLTSLKRVSWNQEKDEQVVRPYSTSEFRNLAGRAGRPGSARGIDGMTLVAVPTRNSATASGQQATQTRQRLALHDDYENLREALVMEEQEIAAIEAPLAFLINEIWRQAHKLLGLAPDHFLEWLEQTAPLSVSENAGTGSPDALSRLADTMDELDSVLLASMVEFGHGDDLARPKAEIEKQLSNMWAKTFSVFAAEQEAWMEHAFVRRGTGIMEHIYPEQEERRRLYQYGFPPCVGRRFENVASEIKRVISESVSYGTASTSERIDVFQEIGEVLWEDRGFGFRIRETITDQELLENWPDVLGWWMNEPDMPSPEPDKLRAWQRFVSENLEFRLGVAIGAVVAQSFAEGAEEHFTTPSVADWQETTGLPWFGFWARELLRWGTSDPFAAFCLSQGIAATRDVAERLRPTFNTWLATKLEEIDSESLINPQHFMDWQADVQQPQPIEARNRILRVQLDGTDGQKGEYSVIPIQRGDTIDWIDPAGFRLAKSEPNAKLTLNWPRNDYRLSVNDGVAVVSRIT